MVNTTLAKGHHAQTQRTAWNFLFFHIIAVRLNDNGTLLFLTWEDDIARFDSRRYNYLWFGAWIRKNGVESRNGKSLETIPLSNDIFDWTILQRGTLRDKLVYLLRISCKLFLVIWNIFTCTYNFYRYCTVLHNKDSDATSFHTPVVSFGNLKNWH